MNRAMQRALEAYPVQMVSGPIGHEEPKFDINAFGRYIFAEGYEQAEKDTIERAIAWLKENANKYIVDLTPTYPDAAANIIVGGMCWEHLKQELEGK